MNPFLLLVAALVPPSAVAKAQDTKFGPSTSILRVNVTSQPYNFALPWQKRPPSNRQGLGALMKDQHILVTAELVQDANYIELELASSGKLLTAKAETVDYEANLALIVPAEDPGEFFKDLIPLEVDSAPPKKGDKFEVWQFEENGSPVTSEIVFEKAQLGTNFLDGSYFLQFEANGSVNYRAGSFTLPVLHGGKLAGMLLSYSSKDEVANILPYPIVNRFFDDAKDGTYDGFPNFGVKFANTLDDQLRSYLQLGPHDGGIMITGVMKGTSAAASGLQVGDVLLEIDGHPIDSRGNYHDDTWGLLALGHLVKGNAKVGDELKAKIVRDGKPMDIGIKLTRKPPTDFLIDPYMFNRGPKFTVLGGILFQELTQTYLESAGKEWRDRAPLKLVHAVSHPEEYEKEGRRKLVVLTGVLPSESTLGYESLGGLIVNKVNDQPINDIRDLDQALTKPVDGLHKIEVDDVPNVLYVDAKQAQDDNTNLLPQRYRIRELKRLE